MRLWSRKPGDRPGLSSVVIPAALTGAAFATHYYAIFLALPLAWSVCASAPVIGPTRSGGSRRSGSIAAAVFFVLSPYVVLEPATAWRDIRANQQIVVERAAGTFGYARTALRYGVLLWRDTVDLARDRDRGHRAPRAGGDSARHDCVAAGLSDSVLPVHRRNVSGDRYLIPLCHFSRCSRGSRCRGLRNGNQSRRWPSHACAGAMPFRDSLRTDLFIRQTDTRTLAEAYIEATVPDGPHNPDAGVFGAAHANCRGAP